MLANQTAPTLTVITIWAGRACLWWAKTLQQTVAGKARTKSHVARRNAAMRAAYARGVDRETITRTIGLSDPHVRQALRGEPTVE